MRVIEERMVVIREEKLGDEHHIRIVHQCTFGQNEEADIIDRLRQTCPSRISLIALSEGQIVGHILFTPVTIHAKERIIIGM